MSHGRKYGEKDSHPIYVWNGILEPKHLERIGPALALFLWLIDRTTKEQNGIGDVLGGKPIPAEEIAESMGIYEQTIRRNLDRLVRHGYIERTLTPRGYTVRVMKSCKFPKRPGVVGQDCTTTGVYGRAEMISVVGQNCTPTPCKDARPNKSKQLSKQKEEAAGRLPACPFWKEVGVDPWEMPPAFRELCEGLYSSKNGQPMGKFMGQCLDGWEALGGGRHPRLFVQAANRIREQEKATNGKPRGGEEKAPLGYLEPMPPLPCKTT